MKKLLFTLTLVSALFNSSSLFAQACPNSPSNCQPAGGPSGGGFEDPNTTTCATQGVAYNEPLEFTMFSVFEFLGTQNVDSIEFLTFDNLPCGLCWAVDQADKRYAKGEDGCLSISGTTNDAAGQYKLAVSLKAWINGNAQPQTIPAQLVDQTGLKILIRVKTSSGTCVTVDTSANANNLTANPANCNTGVNEATADFTSLQLQPNPLTTQGILSFLATREAVYSVRIADVTGKVVSQKIIEVKVGTNSTSVERNNLPAGVYFLLLTDGKTSSTLRFSISE